MLQLRPAQYWGPHSAAPHAYCPPLLCQELQYRNPAVCMCHKSTQYSIFMSAHAGKVVDSEVRSWRHRTDRSAHTPGTKAQHAPSSCIFHSTHGPKNTRCSHLLNKQPRHLLGGCKADKILKHYSVLIFVQPSLHAPHSPVSTNTTGPSHLLHRSFAFLHASCLGTQLTVQKGMHHALLPCATNF